MVLEGSAVPSLGTKVENSPQTVLKALRHTSHALPAEAELRSCADSRPSPEAS